jgi:hypothetical protein
MRKNMVNDENQMIRENKKDEKRNTRKSGHFFDKEI